jgi:hypothetical protein
MLAGYLKFVRVVAADRIGQIGVVVTTSSFITLLLLELARWLGFITNAYVGLVVYLMLPVLFVLGLLLIPLAWLRRLRSSGLSSRQLLNQQIEEEVRGGFSGTLRTIAILTLVNVLFLAGVSARMLHFMDTPSFCGTACHSVMSPEWATYQQSPHARVPCVECHVGEGVGALVSSKLNGAWQVVSASLDLYQRPIPTPVHQLRPARETCERCHWPERFYGSRLQTRVAYDNDEVSTPRYTTLNLKIDAGPIGGAGVHWHVSEANQVRYASVGDLRREMIWVEVRQPDGSLNRYENTRLTDREVIAEAVREMDCVDCHNRATHIYMDPAGAVDEQIRLGRIDRDLPFIRREAVAAISAGYPSLAAAEEGVRAHLEGFYRRSYTTQAGAWHGQIDTTVAVLQEIYGRNVHHGMSIDWGAYPSLLGHTQSPGCFRCHTRELQDADGKWISDDCTLCHSILANQEPQPFAYLQPADERSRTRAMHEYLREEFLSSFY